MMFSSGVVAEEQVVFQLLKSEAKTGYRDVQLDQGDQLFP